MNILEKTAAATAWARSSITKIIYDTEIHAWIDFDFQNADLFRLHASADVDNDDLPRTATMQASFHRFVISDDSWRLSALSLLRKVWQGRWRQTLYSTIPPLEEFLTQKKSLKLSWAECDDNLIRDQSSACSPIQNFLGLSGSNQNILKIKFRPRSRQNLRKFIKSQFGRIIELSWLRITKFTSLTTSQERSTSKLAVSESQLKSES